MEERLDRLEKKYQELETVLIQFIYICNERFEHMALDFSQLQQAVSNVTANIQTAIGLINNPAVDNNDQATIDQLTSLLNNSAQALAAVEPAPAPVAAQAPAPVAQPEVSAPASSADSQPANPTADPSAQPSSSGDSSSPSVSQ